MKHGLSIKKSGIPTQAKNLSDFINRAWRNNKTAKVSVVSNVQNMCYFGHNSFLGLTLVPFKHNGHMKLFLK